MHIGWVVLNWIANYVQTHGYGTLRRIFLFAASILYLVVIISALGSYTKEMEVIRKTMLATIPQKLSGWYMLNIYQFLIVLEIVTYLMNFVGIILMLATSSWNHLKKEKVLKVPLSLIRNE